MRATLLGIGLAFASGGAKGRRESEPRVCVVEKRVGRGGDLDRLGGELDTSRVFSASRQGFGAHAAPRDRGLQVVPSQRLALMRKRFRLPVPILREQCASEKSCPFGRRRRALADAHLVVANHDLMLRWPPDYPTFTTAIADEAHELAGVADEVYAVEVRPEDATVYVDGRARGKGKTTLRLSSAPHSIEVKRPGYQGWRRTVTPRPGYPQTLRATLRSLEAIAQDRIATTLDSPAGQTMRRVEPATFSMGASRAEVGRRANEVIVPVTITRPFLISVNEVTNKEFAQYRANHDSGASVHPSLAADNNPVANVSWEDAVQYCNWLSQREGRTPAYKAEFGQWVPVYPLTDGYRLPTEAEWALAIRYREDYDAAGVPMLPVVVGPERTMVHIMAYSVVLVGTSLLLIPTGVVGAFYTVVATALGATTIGAAWWLRNHEDQAIRYFVGSNFYLAALFAAMAIDGLL